MGEYLPTSMRTIEAERDYQIAKRTSRTIPLADEAPLIRYKNWKLIANRFPYNMVFCDHDMLIPYRDVATRQELNMDELTELQSIIEELSNQYDMVFENFAHRRSIKALYHVHLARYHKTREEMHL